MSKIRVRFAPSPTGPLHIGGVRTALYNYLLAKKNNGSFILRIEDTDRARYVEGAEEYIQNALEWAGIKVDEGVQQGGDFGPYRQSERGEIYKQYVNTLIEKRWAYKAYDTAQELSDQRDQNSNWQYDASTRMNMKNSLSLSDGEIARLEENNTPFVVRFMMPGNEKVEFTDRIRGKVTVETNVLDDKVLFKADGMPTYHMANVIDDHLMEITHVIRGEEWLPSTPLHILLYQAFEWDAPEFAHLPLILKPEGKGKLSKRDGAKFGFPVFPLVWEDPQTGESWSGYRETGFLPSAFTNLLAFLGWNPGTEQELFTMEQMVAAFSLDRVNKSGARFDYDKAKWFNQQHLIQQTNNEIAATARPYFDLRGYKPSEDKLQQIIGLYKERVDFVNQFPVASYYLFEEVKGFEQKAVRKKWKPELTDQFLALAKQLEASTTWNATAIEQQVKEFMTNENLGFGQVLPILRIAVCGTMQGPSIFDVMAILPKETVVKRIQDGIQLFNEMKEEQ